jgi:hypothetical protein
MPHAILLGDSIFDNERYVPGGPAVIDQLRRGLPDAWKATLLAVDGDCTPDVGAQLERLPADATHLFVSCGGNDALSHLDVLTASASSVGEVLARFARIREDFRTNYRRMLEKAIAMRRPVTVCTVYDTIPDLHESALTALALFNEVILREAIAAHVGIIDLRAVFTETEDYSDVSPIEPSEQGGAKIVDVIRRLLSEDRSQDTAVKVYAK